MARITITDLDELIRHNRMKVLDGILTGKPLGEMVSSIVLLSHTFGSDESERSEVFLPDLGYTDSDFELLKRECAGQALEILFGNEPNSLELIARRISLRAAKFGFDAEKNRVSTENKRRIQALLDSALSGEVEPFMQEMKARILSGNGEEEAVELIRQVAMSKTAQPHLEESKGWQWFSGYYSKLLLGW